MTLVWQKKYGKEVEWDGDPQNAPDRCETCDGAGQVYRILLDDLIPSGNIAVKPPIKWTLSTNNLPDDEECPECRGYGNVYD